MALLCSPRLKEGVGASGASTNDFRTFSFTVFLLIAQTRISLKKPALVEGPVTSNSLYVAAHPAKGSLELRARELVKCPKEFYCDRRSRSATRTQRGRKVACRCSAGTAGTAQKCTDKEVLGVRVALARCRRGSPKPGFLPGQVLDK